MPPAVFLSQIRSRAGTICFALAVAVAWIPWLLHVRLEWAVSPQYGYGWAVPVLAFYLWTARWPTRPQPTPQCAWPFILVLLAALVPIGILSGTNPDWRTCGVLLGGIASALGLCLLAGAGGRPWVRYFLFPCLFPLVATPWPGFMEEPLVGVLMHWVTAVTVELAQWLGIPALAKGNLILVSHGMLGVDEACSGVRSLQSSLMAALFLGEFFRLGLRQRILLVVKGGTLAFFLNVTRAVWLVSVVHRDGLGAAARWHDPAGWTIFAVLAAALLGIAWRQAKPASPASEAGRLPGGRGAAILVMAGVGACFALSTLWFWRDRPADRGRNESWTIGPPVHGEGFEELEISDDVRRQLRFREGLSMRWRGVGGWEWRVFYFRWEAGQSQALLSRAHRPEVCLPSAGLVAVDTPPRIVEVTSDGVALRFTHQIYRDGPVPVHVFHALDQAELPDEIAGRDPWALTTRLALAWHGYRHRGGRVLSLALIDPDPAADVEDLFRGEIAGILRKTP